MIRDALPLLGIGTLIMSTWMSLLWVVHRRLKNAGIVDFGWATGLVILAIFYAATGYGDATRRWLFAGIVTLWGGRLGLHILFDRVLGKKEDPRYAQLRESWKEDTALKFYLFFVFQGVLDVVLSIPFLFASLNPSIGITTLEWCGFSIWAIALMGEWTADAQLKRFKADPSNKGKTCQIGLWHLSRHPNYFFEWLIWIGFCVAGWGSPRGEWSIISPLLMLYFLFKVTGIPATEAQAVRTKGDEYRRYQRTTSAFVPWFPKKKAP